MGEIPSPGGIRSEFGNSFSYEYGNTAGIRAWQSFVEDEVSTRLITNTPVTLRFGSSDVCSKNDLISSTVVCDDTSNAVEILEELTKPPSTVNPESVKSVKCGASVWTIGSSCNGTHSAICLNCSNPCTNLDTSYVINWAQETPSNENVQTFFIDYVVTVPPPDILDVNFNSTSKSVLSITANVSVGEGALICAAYRSLLSFVPPSVEYLTAGSTLTTIEDLTSEYIIENLLPAVEYDVYCGTFSKLGYPSSQSQMLKTLVKWTMPCCQELSVDLLQSTFDDASDVRNAIQVYSGVYPPFDLTVTINARSGSGSFSLFSPAVYNFTRFKPTSYKVAYLKGVFGSYDLDIQLSGSSAALYEVIYPNGKTFDVAFANTETATPQFISARFSSKGTKLIAKFDLPTDQAGFRNSFDCAILFTLPQSKMSNVSNHFCVWISSREVEIYLRSDDNVIVGGFISLKSQSVKAKCTSSYDCESWNYVANATVEISAPLIPLIPRVAIVGPGTIGIYDDMTLDVSGSTGTGGRTWLSFSWDVQSEAPNVNRVADFLNNNVTATDLYAPLLIPQQLFDRKMAYRILFEACNFLSGCGRDSLQFIVSDTGAVPVVVIDGEKLKSVTLHQDLVVSGDSYTTNFNGNRDYSNLQFTWQIFLGNTLLTTPSLPQYADVSTDANIFKLPANTLTVGQFYTIRLTVQHAISLKYGYAEVDIAVVQGDIVAEIAGLNSGATVGMYVDESYTFDASSTYDSDYPLLNTFNISTTFTCQQVSPSFSDICDLDMVLSGHRMTVSVFNDNIDFVGNRYLIRLDAVHEFDFRSDFSEVILEIYSLSAAIIKIKDSYDNKINPTEKLKIQATVSFPLSGTAAWSVDDDDIVLSEVALNPHNTTLTARKSSALTEVSLSLVLPKGTLSQSSRYQFTLTVHLNNGITSSSFVTLTTNTPPSIGTFEVDPVLGVQVSTTFKFKTFNCEDEELPLLYEYSFVTLSSKLKVLRSRLQRTTFDTSLSAGDPSNNYTLLTFVSVYDSLNGKSSSPFYVGVTPSAVSDAAVEDALTNSINNANGASSGIKNAIALYTSIVNDVDCSEVSIDESQGISSSASFCKFHYKRDRCSSVANTCGKCLQGYTGESGHSNNLCFPIPSGNEIITFGDGGGLCLSDSDCNAARFEICQPYGRCETSPKVCTQDCSRHGECVYVSKYRSSLTFPSCNVLETGCIAKCLCNASYAGSFCQYNSAEFNSLVKIRDVMVQGLELLVTYENPTKESVLSWVDLIADVTNDPDVLSPESRETIVKLCVKILELAISLNLPYEGMENVVNIIDLTLPYAYESAESNRRLTTYESEANEMFQAFISFIENDMLAGQDPTIIIGDSFRLSSFSIFGHQDEQLSLPKTLVEDYIGINTNAVDLPANQNGEQVRVLLSEQNLEVSVSDIAFQGAILHIDMDKSFCDKKHASTERLSRDCAVNVTLQNFDFGSSVEDESFDRFTRCFYGHSSYHEYRCPSGVNVTAHCDGTMHGKIVSSCAVHQPASACRSLSSFRSRCEMTGYTLDETYCTCSLPGTEDQKSLEYVSYSTNAIAERGSYFIEYDFHEEQDYFMVMGSLFVICVIFVGLFHLSLKGDKLLWEFNGPVQYSDEIEKSLPLMMRSKSLLLRFVDEVKFHHRWLGVIASHKDSQPRYFRLWVLWCRTLMIGFLLALIYRNADLVGQNSCEDHLTEDSCTEENSFLGLGSRKCNWRTIPLTERFDNVFSVDGYCVYIETENSFGRIFFVALFVSLVSVPWSILMQFVFLKVLASGNCTVNKVVPLTGNLDDLDTVMEKDLKQKPVTQNSSYKMNRFGRKEKLKRNISYSKSDGFNFTNKILDVDFESQQEYKEVLAQIRAEDSTALIDAWKIDVAGGDYDLKRKLKKCRQTALKERTYFNSSYISNIDKSCRLIYLFIYDFISTNAMSGKILDSKYRKEQFRPYDGVSETVKSVLWIVVMLTNVAMFLAILILSFEMTNKRQNAWILTVVMWFAIDMILLGFGQVVWSDIFVPSLVYGEVNCVKDCIRKNREKKSEFDSFGMLSNKFDMTKYFFVSKRIFNYFPFLSEANVVSSFQSSWPKSFFEKHDAIYSLQPNHGVVYNLALQTIGALTSLDAYCHDLYLWIFSPLVLALASVVVGRELYAYYFTQPAIVPSGDDEGEMVQGIENIKQTRSYIVPAQARDGDAATDSVVGKLSPNEVMKALSRDDDLVLQDFDDISHQRPEYKVESDLKTLLRRDTVEAWKSVAPTTNISIDRHPIVNNESTDSSKSPHVVPQAMKRPTEVLKGRSDMNPVPRLPEARQDFSKFVSKLSRMPSKLPTITKDLTATSHSYSADRPMNPSGSEFFEPIKHGGNRSLADRDYVDTPTKAKNIARPVIVRSLPSFDVLPPMTREGPRVLTDDIVLTPDTLKKATKVKEGEPSLKRDDTFVAMPRFEDFFHLDSSAVTPKRPTSKNINVHGKDEDGMWVDDAPDVNFDFDLDLKEDRSVAKLNFDNSDLRTDVEYKK